MIAAVLGLLAAAHVLTLDEALQTARQQQPQLRQARANTLAADARAGQAFSGLLPQLNATGTYLKTTANAIQNPGSANIQGQGGRGPTWDLFNSFSDNISLSQLIFDFGAQPNRWRAAKALAEGQAATERAIALTVDFNLRSAYFAARAFKALVQVAKENLDNLLKHLAQTQGMVEAGTRAEIDLIQSRADTANARVLLITAENNYQTSKLTLNNAMGVLGPTDYDIAEGQFSPVAEEDASLDALLEEAYKARPEVQALEDQVRFDQLTIRSIQAQYGPSLNATLGFRQGGPALDRLGWNAAAGLSLSWNIFAGGLTRSQQSEAEANAMSTLAQLDLLRQTVRTDVDGARLALRAAKETVTAAQEALVNARERLRLAEERYQVGVGSAIELGDAQVALTQTAAQSVQAQDQLSTARAQLLRAVGRQ
jgi:outer membrane protein